MKGWKLDGAAIGIKVELMAPDSNKMEGKFRCPVCQELIDSRIGSCKNCKARFSQNTIFACPLCGALTKQSEEVCPGCGVQLFDFGIVSSEKVPPPPDTKVRNWGDISRDFSSRLQKIERELAKPPKAKPKDAAEDKSQPLPPPPPPSEAAAPPSPSLAQEIKRPPTKEPVPPPLPPELEVRRKAPAPQKQDAQPKTRQGRVNGTRPGRVNGNKQGRVNGNFRGRINGNDPGKVNGLKKTSMKTDEKKLATGKSRAAGGPLARWQFIAILVVAILLIAGAAVYFSSPTETSGIKIDGYFSDWQSVPAYEFGRVIPGVVLGVDESRLSFEQDPSLASELYMYFDLQAMMFSGSDASSIYVFIDSDSERSTGYNADASLGADILLVMTGWNGTLMETSEMKYSSTQDHGDWNSWQSAARFPYSIFENQIELSVETALTPPAVMIVTSIAGIEYEGPVMTPSGTILVKQEPLLSTPIATSSTTSLLRVSLITMGVSGGNMKVMQSLVNESGSKVSLEEITVNNSTWTSHDLSTDLSGLARGEGFTYSFSGTSTGFGGEMDVIGSPCSGYYLAYPTSLAVDGMFADWNSRKILDSDQTAVANPDIDIKEYGAASQNSSYFMYVGTVGKTLEGADVPEARKKSVPSGPGGSSVVRLRKTGEDLLQAYIDVDPNSGIGKSVSADTSLVEADYLVEIFGRDGAVTSSDVKKWSVPDGKWLDAGDVEKTGVGVNGIEFSVSKSLLGNLSSANILFITTDWKADSDNGLFSGGLVDPWAIIGSSTTANAYRSNNGITWANTGSISLIGAETIVSLAHSLDRSYVFAVTNTGRIYDWHVNVDSSWGPEVTGPANSSSIVGIAPYSVSGEGSCAIIASNGWIWTNTAVGTTRGWTNGTGKIAGNGITDFKDICYNATGSRFWAIRSTANTPAYYTTNLIPPWTATKKSGSTSPQVHIYEIGSATLNTEAVYILCQDGSIRYAADPSTGNPWAARGNLPAPGTGGLPAGSRYVAIDRDNSGVFWAITNTSYCYRSLDKGVTWTNTGNIGVNNIASMACPAPYIPEFDSLLLPIVCMIPVAFLISASRKRQKKQE